MNMGESLTNLGFGENKAKIPNFDFKNSNLRKKPSVGALVLCINVLYKNNELQQNIYHLI